MPATDRNLLVGVLALQMDFIDRDQLVAALRAWIADKTRALDDILRDQDVIDHLILANHRLRDLSL